MDLDEHNMQENSDLFNSQDTLFGQFADSEVIVKLGMLAANIAYYNFEWRCVTVVMYNTMIHIGVESFLKTYNQTVTLKFGKWLPRHGIHVPQFVIFGQDTSDLSETLQWLVESKYDNTAYYIIICSNQNKCDENEMFQTIASFYMVNVMFLKTPSNGTDPLLFSYYPILPGKCNNNKPLQFNMPTCTHGLCFKQLYPEKLKNFHKCPIVISTLEQPPFMYLTNGVNGTLEPSGADGDVIKVLSEILNGTLVVRTPDGDEWGHFENNNWTGSFGDIFNKRAHASLCSTPLTPQLYGNFQISYTYNSIDMVWAARLPSPKPTYEKLLYPLKLQTRIALFALFVVVAIVHAIMRTKVWKDFRAVLNIGPTKVSVFFYSWFLFLGMPLSKLPTRGTLRTIIITWIWFSHVIRTAYQAALVSSLKLHFHEDYFENFNDVLKNKYPYGGLASLREYYYGDDGIFANWVYVRFSDASDVLDSLLNGSSNFVIALNKDYIIQYLMQYNGTRRVQIIPEKIVNFPAVLYFKKFSPVRAPISHVLSVMVEGGLIDMFYSRYLERGTYLFQSEATQTYKPLNISNVSSSLVILFVGWFLSMIYFFVEVLANTFEKKIYRRSNLDVMS